MKITTIFALTAVLFLAGCASMDNEEVRGPDGTTHILVKCSEMKTCYEKATEACTNGKYTIANSSSDTEGSGDHVSTNVSTTHELLIKCGGSGELHTHPSAIVK